MESHFNKGLELIYNDKIYDIDNTIRNKLIYTTLSIEYLDKFIYRRNVLEDYESINMYIMIEHHINRNILTPFVSYIYKKEEELLYEKCGFFDSDGLYCTYISGKSNDKIKDIPEIFNTFLNNENSITSYFDSKRQLKLKFCPQNSEKSGHTEPYFVEDLDEFIENNVMNNIHPLYIIVDLISTHKICEYCRECLQEYMSRNENVIFRVIIDKEVIETSNNSIDEIVSKQIILTSSYSSCKSDTRITIDEEFKENVMKFYQENSYDELVKHSLTKHIKNNHLYDTFLESIKNNYVIDHSLLMIIKMITKINRESDKTRLHNIYIQFREIMMTIEKNIKEYTKVDLFCSVCRENEKKTPYQWVEQIISSFLSAYKKKECYFPDECEELLDFINNDLENILNLLLL